MRKTVILENVLENYFLKNVDAFEKKWQRCANYIYVQINLIFNPLRMFMDILKFYNKKKYNKNNKKKVKKNANNNKCNDDVLFYFFIFS